MGKPTADLLAQSDDILADSPLLPWIMKVDWLQARRRPIGRICQETVFEQQMIVDPDPLALFIRCEIHSGVRASASSRYVSNRLRCQTDARGRGRS